ncbi:MAG: hypothetical protein WAM69_19805 [Candidatus Sulfotelmatobacter sp.]
MRRTTTTKSARLFAGVLTVLLFATLPIQSGAQPAPDSRSQRPLGFGYDKAHEITFNGTIQEVVSNVSGAPVGLHLLVTGPHGAVDAHLGPYLTKDSQAGLHPGELVQIVGAMEKLHGKDYLLARQLIFGGRTVTVRSENGFLVGARSLRTARSTTVKTSSIESKGDAR